MMKLLTRLCSALVLASCAHAALAGPNEAGEELDRQRLHGFVSPTLAIERLQAAGTDLDHAPVELRMRYHNKLGTLYSMADDFARADAHIAVLRQPASKSRDRSYQDSVGMLLLDVDHFKRINDTCGHAAGDAVLVEVARRLQTLVRQQDAVVRWGGEEFVLLLPGTSAEGMLVLAERVLKTIAEQSVVVDQLVIPVTVSAGCVCYPLLPDQHWEDCLKVADAAMYTAKHGGRNRAVVVMQAQAGDATALLADLDQAAASGQARLHTVVGPAPAQARPAPPAAAA